MTYDIQYKEGDIDTVGALLSDNTGLLDLTGKTITFVMKDVDTKLIKYTITCTPGGTINNIYYSGAHGGVTIPFSATETLAGGLFDGEFVVTGSLSTIHIPSGDNYISIMIWDQV
jgi:hypothetical protein